MVDQAPIEAPIGVVAELELGDGRGRSPSYRVVSALLRRQNPTMILQPLEVLDQAAPFLSLSLLPGFENLDGARVVDDQPRAACR
jgi:hypothetical protein